MDAKLLIQLTNKETFSLTIIYFTKIVQKVIDFMLSHSCWHNFARECCLVFVGETGVIWENQLVRLGGHKPNLQAPRLRIEPRSPWCEASAPTTVLTGKEMFNWLKVLNVGIHSVVKNGSFITVFLK